MKKTLFFFFLLLVGLHCSVFATKPFRFALFSDLHISSLNQQPSEDLQRAISDVNALQGIEFVIISGDVSNLGDTVSLRMAKQLLSELHMPYYIIPGNHDVKWYETGDVNFKAVFGNTHFDFTFNTIRFLGFTSAPRTNKGVGFIQPEALEWMKTALEKSGTVNPFIIITHYPLQTGDVENWKDMTELLKKHDVRAVLGGHYHRNVLFNYDGIPGIINRSTLRGDDETGGYSVYSISDSIRTSEKRIGEPEVKWLTLPFENKN